MPERRAKSVNATENTKHAACEPTGFVIGTNFYLLRSVSEILIVFFCVCRFNVGLWDILQIHFTVYFIYY
jgi:hypothetical protein